MAIVAFVASLLLMVPFFVWGVHTLRVRYLLHRDMPLRLEVYSLAGVLGFLMIEFTLIRVWMGQVDALYAFAALALAAASTALYGPMLVSVISQEIVNIMHPPHDHGEHVPNYVLAEGLETRGDLEGALREYMVMARIFPKDGETAFRVGHVLCELQRWDDAAASFERGLHQAGDTEKSLLATNRLSDIYRERLNRPDDAAATLQAFLDRFGNSPRAEMVRRKLERLQRPSVASGGDGASAAQPPA